MASNRFRYQLTPPQQEEEEEDGVTISEEHESEADLDSDDYEFETDADSEEYESETEGSTGGDDGEEEEVEERGKVGEKEKESILPNCPVCMEEWTSEGPHRVCCIPCGHVYGRLCLEKWLKKCRNKVGKCPQCNKEFKPTDIINLYTEWKVVPNDDLRKEVSVLRENIEAINLERISPESFDALKDEVEELKSAAKRDFEASRQRDKEFWNKMQKSQMEYNIDLCQQLWQSFQFQQEKQNRFAESSQPDQFGFLPRFAGSSMPDQFGFQPGFAGSSQVDRFGLQPGFAGSSKPDQFGFRPGFAGSSQHDQFGFQPGFAGSSHRDQFGFLPGFAGSSQPDRFGFQPGFVGSSQQPFGPFVGQSYWPGGYQHVPAATQLSSMWTRSDSQFSQQHAWPNNDWRSHLRSEFDNNELVAEGGTPTEIVDNIGN